MTGMTRMTRITGMTGITRITSEGWKAIRVWVDWGDRHVWDGLNNWND